MTGVDEVSDPADAPPDEPLSTEGERPPAGSDAAETSGTNGTSGRDPDDRAAGTIDEGRRWWVSELLLTLELVALCAFAFSRPLLDSFGRSPETFVARGAGSATIILFGLLITLVPVAIVLIVGGASRPVGRRVRWRVHLALLGVLGGLAAWRLARDVTGYPRDSTKALLAGAIAVPVLAVLRLRLPSSRTFLRYAGVASVLFLVQFLVTSPTSALIGGDIPGADAEVSDVVRAAVGDDAPPIVFIITDTFPTQALVDGAGNIDPELYPNIAELADTSTWYRNNTTVSGFTNEAVPAMLSGLYPEPSETQQFVVPYPNNLFTLFGDTHEMHVHEPMTRLCPEELCGGGSGGIRPLIADAVDLWLGERDPTTNEIPGLFLDDRYDSFAAWIDEQHFAPSPKPGLYFYHAMLPHEPWSFLPDGSVYEASEPPTGVFTTGWSDDWGHDVGLQRLVMQAQATDRLLGGLFDRLRAAGVFDDALIVVAGDHGQAFVPGQPWRAVTEDNYEMIMWTPLIMKAPGQTRGEVSDLNVETVDILPTMASLLGFDLPFPTDGLVAGGDRERDPDLKLLDDVDANNVRAEDGEPRVEVDAGPGLDAVMSADPVLGTGEDAVFRQTVHGDLVGRSAEELASEPAVEGSVEVEDLDRFGDIEIDEALPIEIVGHTDLPEGTVVAWALNGTVAALTEVRTLAFGNGGTNGLLLPRLFADGDNELAAYVVEGPVGSETLREVGVVDAG